MLAPGMDAKVKPETWAWRGLILAGDSSLLAADSKVGKTTLLVDGIAHWYRGDVEHLGLAFSVPCPPVIIAGTDMPQGRWLHLLHRFGLAETTGGDCFRLLPDGPIWGLFSMDSPIHLDHDGIARLADLASKYLGCLLIAGSCAKFTGALGLKEASADFAGPLGDLQEAVAPYGTTLVVIHHSGRSRAGECAVAASRGTTALPAAVSQCVALSLLNRSSGSNDKRVVLQAEGRGGEPLQLLIEQQETGWISHGDAAEVFAEQQTAQAENWLQDKQANALDVVRERWEMGRQRTTTSVLFDELGMKGANAPRSARRTLQQLVTKGLLQCSKEATDHGQVVRLWPPGGSLAGDGQSPPSPLSDVSPVSPLSLSTEAAGAEIPGNQREGTQRTEATGRIEGEERGRPLFPANEVRIPVVVGGEPGWTIRSDQKLSGRSVAAKDPSGHTRLVDPKDVRTATQAQAPELATAPTISGSYRPMRGAWLFTRQDSASVRRYKRIELRSVRRLIQHQQKTIDLPDGPTMGLRWTCHRGGTFGPKSSAAANQRQRQGRPAPPAPLLDRGQAVAWRGYFRCPRCDQSCLVLFNPLWSWRQFDIGAEAIEGAWMCQPCGKYRWPSSRWTGTSSSTRRRPPSHHYQRHQHAADRCMDLLAEPAWLTTDRWVALHRLKNAHQLIAMAAGCAAWPGINSGIRAEKIEQARRTIEDCRWATRPTQLDKTRRDAAGACRQRASSSGSGNPVPGLIKTRSRRSCRTRAKTCSTGLVGGVGGPGWTCWLWSSGMGFT
jgi:hypothetical protein